MKHPRPEPPCPERRVMFEQTNTRVPAIGRFSKRGRQLEAKATTIASSGPPSQALSRRSMTQPQPSPATHGEQPRSIWADLPRSATATVHTYTMPNSPNEDNGHWEGTTPKTATSSKPRTRRSARS
ncbi:hypothetical protein ColTof4_14015 [Colletotrichum tofieldiae]|nr:hypothetical protein ColTof3_14648 [Colletotrichum tofieldiae]GKT81592.1 hypothetical protein ColTof4_14015 [Colletotrichum tofieldiae]